MLGLNEWSNGNLNSNTVRISYSAIIFGKSMNPISLHPALNKYLDRISSLTLA